MINPQKIQLAFFVVLLGISTIMAFMVYRPFLNVIIIALVLAILLYPIYERILKLCNGWSRIAASVVIVLALIFIITPLAFLSIQIFNQSRDVYVGLQSNNINYAQQVTDTINKPLQSIAPGFSIDVRGLVGQSVVWISNNVANIISGTSQLLLSMLLVVITLFFFLKDGRNFLNYIMKLSPLDDKYDLKIFERVGLMITSVVRGVLLIAVVQAVLVGIGFSIFGVPNATLWATVTVIASLIPFVGTGLVVFPGVAFLLLQGNMMGAVGLAVWGTLLVGLIDNLFMPIMYGKRVQVHSLVILFAVLGGIYAFGPLGFLIGPMVVSLFIAILDIYREYMVGNKGVNL